VKLKSGKLDFLLLGFLFFLLAFFLSGKINLITADLGRHLKNGEIILSGGFNDVVKENLYSYTFADFPFINHHWGSGIIFFLLYKGFGFSGLSAFFVFLNLITFWLFFDSIRKRVTFFKIFLVSILFLPLFVFRQEIRPEVFSYFFCGLFFWLLLAIEDKRISSKWLFVLPFLQMVWINLHVYFFCGFILLGIFWLKNIKKDLAKSISLVIVFSLALSCLNPFGIKGLFFPFKIFENYGYLVLENQSVFFIDKVIGRYPANLFFKISFVVLLASWIIAIKNKKFSWLYFGLFLFISYLGWSAVRNFALYAYFGFWITSFNLAGISFFEKKRTETQLFIFIAGGIFLLFGLYLVSPSYWTIQRRIGWGLLKNNQGSAVFFKENNLKGPIFNNYDIGGYLIFNLYPKEKVFVDNRPEAYPKQFFTETYVPMQQDPKKWQEVSQRYNFNVVFFSRNDLTPWGQAFLISLVQDPDWAPVFIDQFAIIFLKRNEGNKILIGKYEIPKEMFTVIR